LFCAKGIFVKELFSHGFDAEEILALRMITALERVILFSYPSLVLLGGMIFQNQKHGKKQFIACGLTWIGLVLVVADEVSFAGDKMMILYGASLVFLSALIYAAYLLCARPVIHRVGASTSTTLCMNLSCLIVISYYCVNNGIEITGEWTPKTIFFILAIGVLGTVAPTYLLSIGLARVSSSSYAVVSSLGPIITIILASFMAQHVPSLTQVGGMTLALGSSLFINLKSN